REMPTCSALAAMVVMPRAAISASKSSTRNLIPAPPVSVSRIVVTGMRLTILVAPLLQQVGSPERVAGGQRAEYGLTHERRRAGGGSQEHGVAPRIWPSRGP